MKLEGKKKILIIRLSSLGDVVLSSPVVRAIKTQYPGIEIDFLVRPQYEDAVKHNPNISRIFLYDTEAEKLNSLITLFRQENYDAVLDLQNNGRSKKILKQLKVPVVKYKKNSAKRFLLVRFKWNKLKDYLSVPEKYVLGIEDLELDEKGPEIFIPTETRSLLDKSKKYIGICPGSKHITKMWPIENFIELGKQFNEKGYTVVLFGGADDIEICKYISIYVKNSINLANQDNLYQTFADMKTCQLVVCNDSGLMHTACAAEVPVLAIFGSTVKEFGFAPYKSKGKVIENNELKCRPCSHIGKDACPKKHFNCLKSITPEQILIESEGMNIA